MNRREEPLTIRAKKKINKAIKTAVETKEPVPPPRNLRGQNPAKRPKKLTVQEKSRVQTLKKGLSVAKKKKKLHHNTKRSSPGTVDQREAAPAFVHKEGVRWNEVLVKQNLHKDKQLSRRFAKKSKK